MINAKISLKTILSQSSFRRDYSSVVD